MITIVTVTYNNLLGLKATCESVFNLIEKEFQWVVIDGDSTDGTKEFLNDIFLEDKNKRLVYLSEPDRGLYDAMNKALALIEGGYVLFLNAGDTLISPDTLCRVKALIDANPGYAIYAGNSIRFSEKGRLARKRVKNIKHIKYGMLSEHQSSFFNLNLYPDVRYDLRYSLSADYDYFFSFLKNKTMSVYDLKFDVCKFEFGGLSYERRNEAMYEDMLIRYRRLGLNYFSNILIFIMQVLNHKIKILLGRIN